MKDQTVNTNEMSTTTNSVVNRRIAKIDGHYLSTCEERPEDDEHWHHKNDGCCYFDPPPDYRAPENLHELVRVAEEVSETQIIISRIYYEKGIDWAGGEFDPDWKGGWRWLVYTDAHQISVGESLSDALIAAIIAGQDARAPH